MQQRSPWLLGLAALLIGAVLGWCCRWWYDAGRAARVVQVREASTQYHFIKPLLLAVVQQESPDFASLKAKLGRYITAATAKGEASDISAYFHDLNTGRWTGVNEQALYDPSSMLKVAVMVGYLKSASTNPDILTERFAYVPKADFGQHYPPAKTLMAGQYTVKDLLETMIVDSDNVPLTLFLEQGRQALVDVLKSLNIPPPATTGAVDFMSPQMYSRIFRTLYSSTYLPRGLSEYALQLLSLTTFKAGLVAGVPPKLVVAHKFGEHTSTDTAGQVLSRQLHDCGVIYYPPQPFLLCVMTRGQDFARLEKVISDLSRLTYQEISGSK
jgi:beta-lactamase class A